MTHDELDILELYGLNREALIQAEYNKDKFSVELMHAAQIILKQHANLNKAHSWVAELWGQASMRKTVIQPILDDAEKYLSEVGYR